MQSTLREFNTSEELIGQLEQVYGSSASLQKACNDNGEGAEFQSRKSELAATIFNGDYPYLVNFISHLLKVDTSQAQSIFQAVILLRIKAGDVQRDSSNYPAYRHSLRIAEKVLQLADGIITDSRHLTILVIKAVLHDLVEDFDKTDGETNLRKIFNDAIADGVMIMTMPERSELAHRYHNIVAKYSVPEEIKNEPAIFIAYLKEHRACFERG